MVFRITRKLQWVILIRIGAKVDLEGQSPALDHGYSVLLLEDHNLSVYF